MLIPLIKASQSYIELLLFISTSGTVRVDWFLVNTSLRDIHVLFFELKPYV